MNAKTNAITSVLEPYESFGCEEKQAVNRVMESGTLSGFYGSPCPEFFGGKEILALEEEWNERFGCQYSVTCNSNTSGLLMAMGAVDLSPGDEVIVPATTMSATAVTPLFYGGVPIFCDIDLDTFCISVEAVKRCLSERTKAVVAVNLFGHPAPLRELRSFCDERGIYLIEDNAQAPLASEEGRLTGTIGHIGIFSLNYHKHIHCGEGGIAVTDDRDLCAKMQLIRNHGESVIGSGMFPSISRYNTVGLNLRMTEISAAIARVQLKNIDQHVSLRQDFCMKLRENLADFPQLKMPVVREHCTHVFYNFMMTFDAEKQWSSQMTRNHLATRLKEVGVPVFEGYVKPLYHLPVFKEKIGLGRDGFPFRQSKTSSFALEARCLNAEKLFNDRFIGIQICNFKLNSRVLEHFTNGIRLAVEKPI